MTKIVLVAIITLMSFATYGTTSAVAGGNSKHTCPGLNVEAFLDEETGMWVCENPTKYVNGHPAYDEAAKCTPGETREFRVPKKNGGYRIVRQTCVDNFM